MSARHLLVCLPPLDDPQQWAEEIDTALAPHSDDIVSWSTERRYDTHLALRPDAQQGSGLVVQSQRARTSFPSRCSGGRRGLLDFVAMRAEHAERAARLYGAWEAATAAMAPASPFSLFCQRHPQKRHRAREEFLAQPQLQVLHDIGVPFARHQHAEAAALVALDQEAFVDRARQRAVPGDLLLTEHGDLHVNPAFLNSDDADETGSARYLARVNRYLDELGSDHLVFSLHGRPAE
ncbi:hypothetical protein SMD44_p10218 (plasmid) [Streptomyces alboflavus]|uniref:Uncharacterized protein n=1 Tax=Streptomyces alboflavus TaxID=67267 RepID=A0A291W475_9ACTN|nr:hypothetical protein [Streptomyces alboflavus]ATM24717.1 hypothetical protein SMD44_p10218 [Streptomyces alboflavus]